MVAAKVNCGEARNFGGEFLNDGDVAYAVEQHVVDAVAQGFKQPGNLAGIQISGARLFPVVPAMGIWGGQAFLELR